MKNLLAILFFYAGCSFMYGLDEYHRDNQDSQDASTDSGSDSN